MFLCVVSFRDCLVYNVYYFICVSEEHLGSDTSLIPLSDTQLCYQHCISGKEIVRSGNCRHYLEDFVLF